MHQQRSKSACRFASAPYLQSQSTIGTLAPRTRPPPVLIRYCNCLTNICPASKSARRDITFPATGEVTLSLGGLLRDRRLEGHRTVDQRVDDLASIGHLAQRRRIVVIPSANRPARELTGWQPSTSCQSPALIPGVLRYRLSRRSGRMQLGISRNSGRNTLVVEPPHDHRQKSVADASARTASYSSMRDSLHNASTFGPPSANPPHGGQGCLRVDNS
jgi:hypothetical protein